MTTPRPAAPPLESEPRTEAGWRQDFVCYCQRRHRERCWNHPHRYDSPGTELGAIVCQPHGHDAAIEAAAGPPLTPDHLAELRRLAGEATAGPWRNDGEALRDDTGGAVVFEALVRVPSVDRRAVASALSWEWAGGTAEQAVADAAYIVALVNAALALIEAAQREAGLRAAALAVTDAVTFQTQQAAVDRLRAALQETP